MGLLEWRTAQRKLDAADCTAQLRDYHQLYNRSIKKHVFLSHGWHKLVCWLDALIAVYAEFIRGDNEEAAVPLRVCNMKSRNLFASVIALASLFLFGVAPQPASASTFFDNGIPNGAMAAASRPGVGGKIEIESADDFVLGAATLLNSATFTGLITGGSIGEVQVEIYRVFPNDSNVGRTSGPPTFSTPLVPTRVNSPSDVAFDSRSTPDGNLTFTTTALGVFTAANSILNGIHASPNQTTGGDGSVSGQEVKFTVNFTTPFLLPADHYFFVPQVQITGGEFYWLSSGTPTPPDLQGWIRNADLDPDWLRDGTDIVGGGTNAPRFNFSFALDGVATPLPGALPLFATGLGALGLLSWRRKNKAAAPAA